MELDFSNLGPNSFNQYEDIYNELMKKTFSYLHIDIDYIVDVNIVDDEYIHQINKEYRKIDRPTDVISFAFFDDINEKIIPGVPSLLGQIIISFETAIRQAETYSHSIKREMSFLFIHGLLHLLGYDHMEKSDEVVMFSLQNEILGGCKMENKDLIEKAIEARKLSYSPYSHFAVGAALLTKDGRVFLGANIENSSYPLSMCAERNCVYNAYLHGVKKEDIVMLALAADTDGPCAPCGACRQVLSELLAMDTPIIMANLKGDVKETNVAELLPFAFSGDDLK